MFEEFKKICGVLAITAAALGVSVMVSCETEKSRENSHSTANTTVDKSIAFYEKPTGNFTCIVSTTVTGNIPKKTTAATTVIRGLRTKSWTSKFDVSRQLPAILLIVNYEPSTLSIPKPYFEGMEYL